MKKILVIEDNEKHIQDAKDYLESKDVMVVVAANYSEAFWTEPNRGLAFDGVISDIYFPLTSRSQPNEQPIGVRVAIELSQQGTPFVLCTAGYHHGNKYEWINQLARDQGWVLIDTEPKLGPGQKITGDDDVVQLNNSWEAPKKDWKKAYETLEKRMTGK